MPAPSIRLILEITRRNTIEKLPEENSTKGGQSMSLDKINILMTSNIVYTLIDNKTLQGVKGRAELRSHLDLIRSRGMVKEEERDMVTKLTTEIQNVRETMNMTNKRGRIAQVLDSVTKTIRNRMRIGGEQFIKDIAVILHTANLAGELINELKILVKGCAKVGSMASDERGSYTTFFSRLTEENRVTAFRNLTTFIDILSYILKAPLRLTMVLSSVLRRDNLIVYKTFAPRSAQSSEESKILKVLLRLDIPYKEVVMGSMIVVAVLSNVDNSKISRISHTVKSNTKPFKK
jgi:hypothetical protein